MADSRTDAIMRDFPTAAAMRERDAVATTAEVPEPLIDEVTAYLLRSAQTEIARTPPGVQKCDVPIVCAGLYQIDGLSAELRRLLFITAGKRAVAKLLTHGYFATVLKDRRDDHSKLHIAWTPRA